MKNIIKIKWFSKPEYIGSLEINGDSHTITSSQHHEYLIKFDIILSLREMYGSVIYLEIKNDVDYAELLLKF